MEPHVQSIKGARGDVVRLQGLSPPPRTSTETPSESRVVFTRCLLRFHDSVWKGGPWDVTV